MSRRIPTTAVAAILLATTALPVLAQTPGKDAPQKTTETGEAIRDYTVEKKDEAVAYARKLVADLDARIKELEAEASKQTGEARAKVQEQIKDLKAKRAAASRKLEELTRASRASWEHAKQGFADAYRDLAQAFEKAAGEFRR